jgi:hypothetical protein
MQDEVAAIEQPHVTRWHYVSSRLERQHENQCAQHSDDDAVLHVAVYSDTETNIHYRI